MGVLLPKKGENFVGGKELLALTPLGASRMQSRELVRGSIGVQRKVNAPDEFPFRSYHIRSAKTGRQDLRDARFHFWVEE